MLSHDLNITVLSVSITWGKLYGNSLDDSKCIEMQKAALLMYAKYPIQKYKFTHYCMWGIDWKRLNRIDSTTSLWYRKEKEIYGHKGENTKLERQTQETHLSHCKPWLTTCSTIVALISSEMCLCPWPLLPLPLFCLCTLPPCILTPLLPLGCWLWSFSECSSIVRICNPCVVLCLYMLSYWRFMRCTFELFQRTGL